MAVTIFHYSCTNYVYLVVEVRVGEMEGRILGEGGGGGEEGRREGFSGGE